MRQDCRVLGFTKRPEEPDKWDHYNLGETISREANGVSCDGSLIGPLTIIDAVGESFPRSFDAVKLESP